MESGYAALSCAMPWTVSDSSCAPPCWRVSTSRDYGKLCAIDYQFIESLDTSEARALADQFKAAGDRAFQALVPQLRRDAIRADWTIATLPGVLEWIASQARIEKNDTPPGTPAWISDAMEAFHGGFREIADTSLPLFWAASYYLGESFVRTIPSLRWDLGNANRADVNQPVVAGFRTGAEMPPLVVAENLLLGQREDRFENAVQTWAGAA